MTSTLTNRRQGVNSGAAVKIPCRAASTGNLTLEAEQTVDGVSVVSGDRVLVKNQTNAKTNGIYVVSTAGWERDLDFDGTFDVLNGTLISVLQGNSQAATYWRVVATGQVSIDSTDLSFELALVNSASMALYQPSGTDAVSSSVRDELDRHVVSSLRFMTEVQRNDVLGRVGSVDVSSPIQKWADYCETHQCTGDGVPGFYLLGATITVNAESTVLKCRGPNTVFLRTADYGDTFVFTGNDVTGATLNNCGLSDCRIYNGGTMTSGAHIWLNGAFIFYGQNLRVENGFVGFRFSGARRAYMNNLEVAYSAGVAAGRIGMLFDSAAATYAHPSCSLVLINGFNVQGPSQAAGIFDYGVVIKSSDGIWMSNGHLGAAAISNYCLSAELAGSNNFINHAYLDFTEIDAICTSSAGVQLKGSTNSIFSCRVSNTNMNGGAAVGNHAVLVDAGTDADNFEVNNSTGFFFVQESMKLLGGRNYKINNFNSRCSSNTTAGAYSGIYLENVSGAQFMGGSSGRDNLGSLNIISQKYGIEFGSGNTDITMDGGMDLQGNILGSIGGGAGQYRTGNVLLEKTASAAVLTNLVKVGGMNFDGATNYLDGFSTAAAATDSKKFTFAAKVRFANAASGVQRIYSTTGLAFDVQRAANGALTILGENDVGTIILNQSLGGGVLSTAGTYTILVSADLAVPGSMQFYVNETKTSPVTSNTFTDYALDFTTAENAVFADVGGNNKCTGDVYILGLTPGIRVDFSAAVNRRKFFDRAGNIMDWGSDGTKAFGGPAMVLIGGRDYPEFPTNRGSVVAAFTVNGTPATPATPDYSYEDAILTEFTVTAATHTVGHTITSLIGDRAAGTITLTLDVTVETAVRELLIRTVQAQAIVSGAADVVPLTGGAAGTAICAATAGKWARLRKAIGATTYQIVEGN